MENGSSSYSRFLDGDDNGLVEIIRDYKDGLMIYINRIVCNISVAEELTEDTFVKIAVKKPKYKEKKSFKSWLYTIGRNIAIDYIKKNHRISNKPVDDYNDLYDKNDIEINYLKNEEKIEVHRALNNLKTEYSQVIYLTYFEGLSNTDAAAVMHKSKRQIENLLYNAKKSFEIEIGERRVSI